MLGICGLWYNGYHVTSEIKLGDYLSVQAHKPCSISHLLQVVYPNDTLSVELVKVFRYKN